MNIFKRLFNWLFKKKEPIPDPPLKQEIKPSVDESIQEKARKMNKQRKENGYICCNGCGRSTGLYRMTLHKRILVKGNKKKKVYLCESCLRKTSQ